MRHRHFLVIAAALFFTPALVSANEAPPGTGSAVTQNAPANPPPPVTGDAANQTARKEEEDSAGLLARIKAYATSKTGLANNISGLEKKNADLTAALADRDSRLAALDAENKTMRADLTAIANWLQENGHATAQAAAANPAAAFQTAVGNAVANEIRQIGVPAATVKTAAVTSSVVTDEVLNDAIAVMQAEKDPVKKGRLCEQVTALRAQISKKGSN